jgi:hypothetical protein
MHVPRSDTWIVLWLPAPNRWGWRILAGRGAFAHCLAIRHTVDGCWLYVDGTVWGLNVVLIDEDSAFRLLEAARRDGHALLVRGRRRMWRWWPPLIFSCTEAILLLLGLRSHAAWTPRQLYHLLLRQGAEEL